MKRLFSCLLAAMMMVSLVACSPKDMVQDAVKEALGAKTSSNGNGGAHTSAAANSSTSGSVSGETAANNSTSGSASTEATDDYDAEYTIYLEDKDEWTPFPGSTGVVFVISEEGVLQVSDDGAKIAFTGKQVGESVITATLDGQEAKALVRVRAREGGSAWMLRIDEVTVLDVMSLAVVNYDIDLAATHNGADMFGEYTGEIAVEYSADLSGLQSFLNMSGMSMDYKTDGWFKNTAFRMELAPYSEENETRFVESLKDPTISDEERELTNSYMNSMLAGVGSGDKDFETSGKPIGLWYDWAFHMTEGDMSAYVNMTSAMFSASASQNETAQTAEGYAHHMLAGSFHESLSYENESPFPYQIEVYESGEAVLTLRSPAESPIVVKFYGTLTQN
jgi:hypothetical protein